MATETTYKKGTFARFFKAVKGRLVSRYGTARYGKGQFLNATIFGGHRPTMKEQDVRNAKIRPLSSRPCNAVELDLSVVTPITHAEAMKYRREYDGHVRSGDLDEVKETAYVAWLKADAERATKLLKKAADLKKKRTKDLKNDSDGSASAADTSEPGGSPG
jgi:hypothetical protein